MRKVEIFDSLNSNTLQKMVNNFLLLKCDCEILDLQYHSNAINDGNYAEYSVLIYYDEPKPTEKSTKSI